MSREERILAFIEGELDEEGRQAFLDELARDPELAQDVSWAAAGLEAARSLALDRDPREANPSGPTGAGTGNRRLSPWWLAAAAAAATLTLSVPATLWLAADDANGVTTVPADVGQPVSPEPSYVLVLHGLWPDRGSLDQAETRRRAAEYWDWTASLAEDGRLLAAGDLRWEAGSRLGPGGRVMSVAREEVQEPTFVVGMFALRAESYEEAVAVARECPHLRYGGSVSIRRVGGGFVTTPGLADWED